MVDNVYRLMSVEDGKLCFQQEEEGFLICEGKVTALLAEDLPLSQETGVALLLKSNAVISCFAGVAGISMSVDKVLGGWCTFECRLAVPRRFAVRAGAALAEGVDGMELIAQRMREALKEVFENAVKIQDQNIIGVHKRVRERIQPVAEKYLMDWGWKMTCCKLQNVVIARSE